MEEIEVRTSEEQLQRMEALVKRMAKRSEMHATGHDYDEARAIVAEIDGPRTDEDWAKHCVGDDWAAWSPNARASVVAAIAKGRELERAERITQGAKFHASHV